MNCWKKGKSGSGRTDIRVLALRLRTWDSFYFEKRMENPISGAAYGFEVDCGTSREKLLVISDVSRSFTSFVGVRHLLTNPKFLPETIKANCVH